MHDSEELIPIRILNQSAQLVKAVIRFVNGLDTDNLACKIIIAGKSEYLCIPQEVILQNGLENGMPLENMTIYLYYCSTVTSQWLEFATVPVDSLNENLLWITEENGSVILTPYGCSDNNGANEETYYLQLTNDTLSLGRIYCSYYISEKFHSKKMSAVTIYGTKRITIPIEAVDLTIKLQYWDFNWKDVDVLREPRLENNRSFRFFIKGTDTGHRIPSYAQN